MRIFYLGLGIICSSVSLFLIVIYLNLLVIGYTFLEFVYFIISKGIIFLLTTMFLQNIIFIPVIICMAVSCIRLYKSIMKDKRRENIKLEIIRHTLVSIMLFIVLVLATLIEVYISTNLLMLCINMF